MKLTETLSRRRDAILGRWKEMVFATYPASSSSFLSEGIDRFANPVGHALAAGLEQIYEGLETGQPPRSLGRQLDEIVRVRCVQDYSPSQALAFVLQLKSAFRREVRDADAELLRALDALSDELMLAAIDVYAACRDDMHAIRARNLERRTYHLVEMAKRANASVETDAELPAEEGTGQ